MINAINTCRVSYNCELCDNENEWHSLTHSLSQTRDFGKFDCGILEHVYALVYVYVMPHEQANPALRAADLQSVQSNKTVVSSQRVYIKLCTMYSSI